MSKEDFIKGASAGFDAFIDIVKGDKDIVEAMEMVKSQLEEE